MRQGDHTEDDHDNNLSNEVIDKNGPPKTGGTGIKQLRENIAESKLSYEIMDDAAQVRMIGLMMLMKESIAN